MSKSYFTLATREDDGLWYAQFGDYDRDVVKQELDDYADGGSYRRKDMRVVVTGDDQASVERGVRRLNYPLSARAY